MGQAEGRQARTRLELKCVKKKLEIKMKHLKAKWKKTTGLKSQGKASRSTRPQKSKRRGVHSVLTHERALLPYCFPPAVCPVRVATSRLTQQSSPTRNLKSSTPARKSLKRAKCAKAQKSYFENKNEKEQQNHFQSNAENANALDRDLTLEEALNRRDVELIDRAFDAARARSEIAEAKPQRSKTGVFDEEGDFGMAENEQWQTPEAQ